MSSGQYPSDLDILDSPTPPFDFTSGFIGSPDSLDSLRLSGHIPDLLFRSDPQPSGHSTSAIGFDRSPSTTATLSKDQILTHLTLLTILGTNHPLLLTTLSSIAGPVLPDEDRRPLLLRDMFTELNHVCSNNSDLTSLSLQQPEQDNLPFRMFLNLRTLTQLICNFPFDVFVTVSAHFQASSNPRDLSSTGCELHTVISDMHQRGQLFSIYNQLQQTPPSSRRPAFLDLRPSLPLRVLPPLVDLFCVEIQAFLYFCAWFASLKQPEVMMIGRLLALPITDVHLIRNHFQSSSSSSSSSSSIPTSSSSFSSMTSTSSLFASDSISPALHTSSSASSFQQFQGSMSPGFFDACFDDGVADGFPDILDFPLPTVHLSSSPIPQFDHMRAHFLRLSDDGEHKPSMTSSSTSAAAAAVPSKKSSLSPELVHVDSQAKITILTQPNPHNISQRLLKPAPQIRVEFPSTVSPQNLFVECTLVRSDTNAEMHGLSGTQLLRVASNRHLVFDKLKILPTTQQRGTSFRLCFSLKYLTQQSTYTDFPSVVTRSQPLDVYANSAHLPSGIVAAEGPLIDEIVPSQGPPGCRVAVLGSRFTKSAALCVRFSRRTVPTTFHEAGTLLCTSPLDAQPGETCDVQVSNDGKTFSTTRVTFTFT